MPENVRKHNEFDLVRGETGDITGSDLQNDGYRGVIVFLDVTSVGGTSPELTVTIQGRSPTGSYYDILVGATVTATGLATPLIVYPSVAAVANEKEDQPLPPRWRINVDTDATTGDETYDYDVAYAYVP